jgi:hypothetical protein
VRAGVAGRFDPRQKGGVYGSAAPATRSRIAKPALAGCGLWVTLTMRSADACRVSVNTATLTVDSGL